MNTGLSRMIVGLAVTLSASLAGAAETVNGRDAYEMFNCGLCHGDDARTPKRVGAPRIAGLDRVFIADRTARMSAEAAHIEALGGSCGELPNKAQIQTIAEWVSGLAR